MSDPEITWERATISVPTDLLSAGKKKAKEEHRSFSAYVSRLVEADLGKGARKPEAEKEIMPR